MKSPGDFAWLWKCDMKIFFSTIEKYENKGNYSKSDSKTIIIVEGLHERSWGIWLNQNIIACKYINYQIPSWQAVHRKSLWLSLLLA